ncbi:glycoside hydrolase family 10 protein [Sporormia fimetaria CBS 119925]|uniref:Beta-xylanase n=1 Tax=Sporormia fimetaria CBS 119925 TaxID=1340428 RepID=A0A6A6V4J4_9PLEO|nr:glycoside hydrolase family 10 protein [Sporormia fimetaria CBS 119925]
MKVTATLAALASISAVTAAPSGGPGRHGPGGHHGPKGKYPGLDVLAKRAGLQYFGTAIDNVVLNNTQYTSIAHNKSEFGQVTPSNGMKWMFTEPERGVFNWTAALEIVKPARKARQLTRCHAFVWHTQLPAWIDHTNWTKPELVSILENHIKNEARAFKDDCIAWDVVNEAFNEDGTYRETIFYKVIGKEYIELAFKFARKYTPRKTMLYYNDYNIETVNNKSLAVAELVKDFQRRRIPIDGVGLQAHYTVGRSPSYQQQMDVMKMFNDLKMEVAMTELDVRQPTLPETQEMRIQQAEAYRDAVKACRDAKNCIGVTVWDFWDPVSWVPYTFPGQGNACLWDDNFNKKEAYYYISDMLRE